MFKRTALGLFIFSLALLFTGCQSAPEPEPEIIEEPEVEEEIVPEVVEEPESFDLVSMAQSDDLTDLLGGVSDPYQEDEQGNTPLHIAAAASSYRAALFLLSLGADVSAVNVDGETPLHLAAESNSSTIVDFLLNQGAAIDATDNYGNTPLHAAVSNGALESADLLSKKIAPLLIENQNGERPLFMADGNEAMLDALLPPSRIDAVDLEGNTLLIALTKLSSSSLARQLISRGAETEPKDPEGNRALDIALASPENYARTEIAAALISVGSLPRAQEYSYLIEPIRERAPDTRDMNGNPPLILAFNRNHRAFFSWLLDTGANPDALGAEGLSALHLASREGRLDEIQELLDKGATPELLDRNGLTPLHWVDALSCSMIVPRFIAVGADLNVGDPLGNTLLHEAVASDWPVDTIVSMLFSGADPNRGNDVGDTPLHLAVRQDDALTLEALLRQGGNPLNVNEKEEIPFIMALSESPELQQLFIEPQYTTISDSEGNSLLHLAVREGVSMETLDAILAAGWDADQSNLQGRSPLHLAVLGNFVEALAPLYTAGADPFLRDSQGETPLLLAARRQPDLLENLLLQDTSGILDHQGNSILHHYAEFGPSEAVDTVLTFQRSPEVQNTIRQRPIHLAAAAGQNKSVRILLDYEAEPSPRDQDGNTPLHLISDADASLSARFLLDNGAEINARNSMGRTPLMNALLYGRASAVDFFLDEGALTELADNQGNTPLHIAVRSGSVDKVNLLLRSGVDLLARNNDGDTPLHLSVREGHLDIADVLLQSDSGLFARNGREETPLDLILTRGSDTIRRLLTPELLSLVDDAGNNVLHRAINSEYSGPVVRSILDLGANPDTRNSRGFSPLSLAVQQGKTDIIRLLLDYGANIHSLDSTGKTPAILALQAGNQVLSLFIGSGALRTVDTQGNTLLHLAVYYGNVEGVSALIEAGLDPFDENLDGKTALDIALDLERNAIVDRLTL